MGPALPAPQCLYILTKTTKDLSADLTDACDHTCSGIHRNCKFILVGAVLSKLSICMGIRVVRAVSELHIDLFARLLQQGGMSDKYANL